MIAPVAGGDDTEQFPNTGLGKFISSPLLGLLYTEDKAAGTADFDHFSRPQFGRGKVKTVMDHVGVLPPLYFFNNTHLVWHIACWIVCTDRLQSFQSSSLERRAML